ncbi:MAG: M16 family metallopeptidase, partial [Hominimerdicola sp.]
MAFFFNREQIGNGINLTRIYDPKFKSGFVKVSYITSFDLKSGSANALLCYLLGTSNAKLKSRTELSQALAGLYGSSLGVSYDSVGDYQSLSVYVDFIGDKYTIGGEVISTDAVNILLDCILNPDITDGKFNEDYFRLRKQEIIDTILATINNKRRYAYNEACKIIYENEPAGIDESVEVVESITQEDLFRQYEYINKSAAIEIAVCGGEPCDSAVQLIKDAFSKIHRENVLEPVYRSNSPLKPEVREAEISMNVNQSKMVMGFKSSYEDIYTVKIFCAMLGGTPFSKLFANVREKMSLCYYCSAGYNDRKGTMIIDSGVETENIEKAREAILQQLDFLCNGDFTDEEL